ncbi:prephenate dehydratase [Calderihabitans maritimus]|uniref:Prephenate dehydratase n=1 Tax=Calderihabitans maritimus TaxID=1246530 RepID=A0A1Z5HN86_9FIRM|nr:prephenate dehydratase [Calderihabitans maritimus]GAW90983.1 prephenate dehydratase [Calderihabitans maritimus]
MKLGYLGPQGTFSQQAAQRWIADKAGWELVSYESIPEVILGVAEKRLDAAVVPVENSIEGTVNVTLDMLVEEKSLSIIGEVILEVHHHLIGKQTDWKRVQAIYSHPQALAQCRGFLRQNFQGVSLRTAASTAEAARIVASGPDSWAAISSRFAAELYGLQVLAENIEDYRGNKTRFITVGRGPVKPTGKDKTSMVLALPQDRPGGLYRVLEEFAAEEINLTKIESRPTKKELGEYLFFLDCEGHATDPKLSRVLDRLRRKTALLRILGSYPRDMGEQK